MGVVEVERHIVVDIKHKEHRLHARTSANLNPLIRPVEVLGHDLDDAVKRGLGGFAVQKCQTGAPSDNVDGPTGVFARSCVVNFGLCGEVGVTSLGGRGLRRERIAFHSNRCTGNLRVDVCR